MLNKKKILLVLMAILLAVTLISCQKSAGSSAEADQAAPAEKVEKIVWKSSGHGPASDPSQIYHDKLCNAITKATDGRLTVKPGQVAGRRSH